MFSVFFLSLFISHLLIKDYTVSIQYDLLF
jgi:hypothetical protein